MTLPDKPLNSQPLRELPPGPSSGSSSWCCSLSLSQCPSPTLFGSWQKGMQSGGVEGS